MRTSRVFAETVTYYIKTSGSVSCDQESRCEYIGRKKENNNIHM